MVWHTRSWILKLEKYLNWKDWIWKDPFKIGKNHLQLVKTVRVGIPKSFEKILVSVERRIAVRKILMKLEREMALGKVLMNFPRISFEDVPVIQPARRLYIFFIISCIFSLKYIFTFLILRIDNNGIIEQPSVPCSILMKKILKFSPRRKNILSTCFSIFQR